jgi:DNA-binding MarR family transcriptional regulator
MALTQPDSPPMATVAAVLGVDRTTLTAALKPLVRRGLVVVSSDRKDSRIRRLALTSAGANLLAEAYEIWERTHGELEVSLGPANPAELKRHLEVLAAQR